MTRQLRQGKGRTGLILANGGVMSYQHVLCLSSSGRQGGSPYPIRNPLPEGVTDLPVPTVDAKVEGSEEATIEVNFQHRGEIEPFSDYGENCPLTSL